MNINDQNINLDKTYTAHKHYKGKVAKFYNKERSSSLKWRREQNLIKKMINELPKCTILDLPIGTGRLLPFYKKQKHSVYGIDISKDMLNETREYSLKLNVENIINLKHGNAEQIPLNDKSVDYVICLRLLNLVPMSILKNIIKEFTRVSQKGIVIQIRVFEEVKAINLLKHIFLDIRTHLNVLLHFIVVKTIGIIVNNKSKKSELSSNDYFIHSFEGISGLIQEQGLYIEQTHIVDRSVNIKKRNYQPFLILKCLKKS